MPRSGQLVSPIPACEKYFRPTYPPSGRSLQLPNLDNTRLSAPHDYRWPKGSLVTSTSDARPDTCPTASGRRSSTCGARPSKPSRHERHTGWSTARLEGRPTPPGAGAARPRLASRAHRGNVRREQERGQPLAESRPAGRSPCIATATGAWTAIQAKCSAAGSASRLADEESGSVRLQWRGLDRSPRG
jgi:hypothetical protein